MSDLISRSALLKHIDRCIAECKVGVWKPVLTAIRCYALDAPAVDAVPVVHCKECNHWKRNMHVNTEHGLCKRLSSISITMHENEFCSRGEMKNDG